MSTVRGCHDREEERGQKWVGGQQIEEPDQEVGMQTHNGICKGVKSMGVNRRSDVSVMISVLKYP